jgi:hypothetical protein
MGKPQRIRRHSCAKNGRKTNSTKPNAPIALPKITRSSSRTRSGSAADTASIRLRLKIVSATT